MAVEGRRRVYQRWSFALSPVYDVRRAQLGRSAGRWSEGGQEEGRSCDVEGQDGNEEPSIFNCDKCACGNNNGGSGVSRAPADCFGELWERECCEAHN